LNGKLAGFTCSSLYHLPIAVSGFADSGKTTLLDSGKTTLLDSGKTTLLEFLSGGMSRISAKVSISQLFY
jgi:hypothetical protein